MNQMDFPATLTKSGKRGTGNTIGQRWDQMLSKKIAEMKPKPDFVEEDDEEEDGKEENVESQVIPKITEMFKIKFFDSHFPLYGYMWSRTEESPKVYLWQGDADAVGWYEDDDGVGRYVIVDWKVLDILEFWKKNPNAYGKYLHQSLVYARLLQLHLELDYMPHILIVPINGLTGKDIHPALFSDYPEKCKEMIESFGWSTTLPEPAQKIDGKRPFNNLATGKVDQNMLLTDFFAKDAKVSDLLKVFGWHAFEVIKKEEK